MPAMKANTFVPSTFTMLLISIKIDMPQQLCGSFYYIIQHQVTLQFVLDL